MLTKELPASHAREDKRHCWTARGRVVGGEVDVLLHLRHLLLQLLHRLQLLQLQLIPHLLLVPPALQDSEVENKILQKRAKLIWN